MAANRDYVQENDSADHACFIASGLVGRFGQTVGGDRQITAFHIPGDMADLNMVVRPLGIGGLTALSEATILQVQHDDLRSVAARFPAVAEAFWRDCMLDAGILMQWVVNVGRRSARTRLAHLFCEMAIRFGVNRDVLAEYYLPLTQAQLGDATALTGVHVNRTLQSLASEGVLTFARGQVKVYEWDRLVNIAEFDATYLVGDGSPERHRRLLVTN